MLFHEEQYLALYGSNDVLMRNITRLAPLLAVLVVFSIWWALRAIRRAEPA